MPTFLSPKMPCTMARVPTAPTAPAAMALTPSIANVFAPSRVTGLRRRRKLRCGLLRRRRLVAIWNGLVVRRRRRPLVVRFFLRGLLKSINSSPSGFFLRALALGRETLRTVRVVLRRGLMALLRRAAERFTKRPFRLRCARRRDRELFFRGLINRTRLNSG